MNTDVIITCALNGAGDTADKHPGLPITPEQIANAAIEAANAGAAIAHIHVRDPETGKGARDPALFAETVARIRDSDVDIVLNLTTGMGGDFYWNDDNPYQAGPGSDLGSAAERVQHVLDLKPEICSLDVATMNFHDCAFLNPPDALFKMAELIKESGAHPELECFDVGHIRLANWLVEQGYVEGIPIYQICLGVPWGAPSETESMVVMRNLLPENAVWSAFGISRAQMAMAAQSMILGGNIRVGLEDNLYLDRGVLASNGQLVERAAEIVARLGGRVLSPAEARTKLGLEKRS
ncbi:MAG: 3-keto-5-aminohexanoate cleavage protein [Pseudomonadota bacterium]